MKLKNPIFTILVAFIFKYLKLKAINCRKFKSYLKYLHYINVYVNIQHLLSD